MFYQILPNSNSIALSFSVLLNGKINDVLHSLNYLAFVADVGSDEYGNFNDTKKLLKDKFQDVVSKQLIYVLGIIDDLRILFLRQDFHEVNPLIESKREIFFTLYEKKTMEE